MRERSSERAWTPSAAAGAKVTRSQLAIHPVAGVTWIERRPALQGRSVLVASTGPGTATDVTPPTWSIAAAVNEYGGRAYAPVPGRGWWLVDAVARATGFLGLDGTFRVARRHEPDERFGDLAALDDATVLAVRELHGTTVERSIVALRASGELTTLVSGRAFLSDVVVDGAGADATVAFVAWDHPQLPWLAAEVWRGRFDGAAVVDLAKVAGGVGRPAYAPILSAGGALTVAADLDGVLQIVSVDGTTVEQRTVAPFDHAEPPWTSQERTAAAIDAATWICARRREGFQELVRCQGGEEVALPSDLLSVEGLVVLDDEVLVLGATARDRVSVWRLGSEGSLERWSAPGPLVGAIVAFEPRTIAAPDGRPIEGFVALPRGVVTPPLVVHCHGGPTDAVDASFDPTMQVLLDAGYAVALVNYRGSTGFGAAYRDALLGQWGIADVADVCDYARGLAAAGLVDCGAMVVRGGSAGGFTALRALAQDVFVGATSLYGVTDLLRLAASSHDFEAHYLDHLVGPLPEAEETYRDRSPILHPDELRGAVLLLQGSDDPVVPAEQSRELAQMLDRLGRPVTLVEFEGEGHGFRSAAAITAALEAELTFYENLLRRHRAG